MVKDKNKKWTYKELYEYLHKGTVSGFIIIGISLIINKWYIKAIALVVLLIYIVLAEKIKNKIETESKQINVKEE